MLCVDVELGGSGLVVRRCLVAVDRAPREQRTAQVELGGAGSRLGQRAVPEAQQVPGDSRLGVGEERQDPRLGVPEVVPVIGVARETLRRDAGAFCSPCRLGQMEEVPANRLLHADGMADGVLDRHVGSIPEAIEMAPLGVHERLEAGGDDTVECGSAPPCQLLHGCAA